MVPDPSVYVVSLLPPLEIYTGGAPELPRFGERKVLSKQEGVSLAEAVKTSLVLVAHENE